MKYTLIFNEDNENNFNENTLKDLDILMNEFSSFNHNYSSIMAKLGNIKITSQNITTNFKNTFTNHADFLGACTLLRPFLLAKENYYEKTNSIIRSTLLKNSIDKDILKYNLDIFFPKNIANIFKLSPIIYSYKNQKIKDFFSNIHSSSKIRNVMGKYLQADYSLKINNYEMFDIYLYAFVFHREKELQDFITNVMGIKDIIKPNYDSTTIFTMMNFYTICFQLLVKIFKMGIAINYINNYIQYDKKFFVEFYDKNDEQFGQINIKEII